MIKTICYQQVVSWLITTMKISKTEILIENYTCIMFVNYLNICTI